MRKPKPAEKRQGGPARSCAQARSAIFCRCDSGVAHGRVGWEVMLHHFKRILGVAVGLVAVAIGVDAEGGSVDLQPPSFSNPTNITNPLFPVAAVRQSLKLG